ncbi:MAG: hypothetical protein QGG64_01490, partial [Candidatus Latescibacteria bacterium]|nr:hypothetical protein [Candidatus Latescibacterota bacterium]
ETPHQAQLFEEAQNVVPKGATALKAPALRLEQKAVTLTVAVSKEIAGDWGQVGKDAAVAFKAKTGFDLVWDRPDVKTKTSAPKQRQDAWEINKAYGEIRKAFQDQAHTPSKVGLKGGSYIEVAFISPAVGERYRDLMNEVGEKIGWKIQVRPSANQEQIAQEARTITPDDCMLRGAAKIYPTENRVVVPVVNLPEEGEALAVQFDNATGFAIDWELPKG